MNQKGKEDALYDELFTIERELMHQMKILIEAQWDSNTVKTKIEKLMKSFEKVDEEIGNLENQS